MLVLSIGYSILMMQPQPELNRTEIHAAAVNHMGISPSSSSLTHPHRPLEGLTVAIAGAKEETTFTLIPPWYQRLDVR